MRIGIVGWGVEGQSAYRHLGPNHEYLIVNEHPRDDFPPQSEKVKIQFIAEEKPPGITSNVADLSYLDGVENCDKIVYSVTSVKNLERKFGDDKDFWEKAATVWHIFFKEVKTKNLIGVTGTKGKGTTATLIHQMLQAALRHSSGPSAGPQVFLTGNIGTSVLDTLKDVSEGDWVVLEITNFQLYKLPYSPHIAVCLMITREHQDWHVDMEEYVAAKANLFRYQKPDDIAIYFAKNELSKQIAGHSPGQKIPYFAKPGAIAKDEGVIVVGDPETEIIKTDEVKLLGDHNLENICAAITAVWFSLSEVEDQIKLEAMRKVLAGFSGLEHRLEFVKEVDGVKYYDDSFGTTPDTAIVALRAFVEPKVVILGGHDKGLPFDSLIDEVLKQRVRKVIAVGTTGPKITEMLAAKGYKDVITDLTTMPQIVAAARQVAEPGDVVLLSAGTSSFGLFKDYQERGDKFKQAVLALS